MLNELDRPLPVTPDEFEEAASRVLPQPLFDFIAGGAESELTVRENRDAFNRFRLRPRMLRDVTTIDLSVSVLGTSLDLPLFVSPMGMHRLVHSEGEIATAKATAAIGVGYMVSTASSTSLEDLAQVAGPARWFQLYWSKDRELTRDLVRRAKASGYRALVLSVDAPVIGLRRRDLRNRYQRPADIRYANFEAYGQGDLKDDGTRTHYFVIDQIDKAVTWADLAWLKGVSELPVVVKGILTGEDARLAVDSGADGVMVSNHGGRQLDQAPASIDVLEEVVNAIEGRAPVLIDGGIRRAGDIAIALGLGASAVAFGRPLMWALACGGEEAATRLFKAIRSDLERTFALLGVTSARELNRSYVASSRAGS